MFTFNENLSSKELDVLLNEAIATTERWEGQLGIKGTATAGDAFRALKEGKLLLGSPESSLRVLRSKDLESTVDRHQG